LTMDLYTLIFNILSTILDIIKTWWWALLPVIFWYPFLFFWLWWRRELWISKQKSIFLELRMPKDVLRPIKAMEHVFCSLWGILYGPPDPLEKWLDGEVPLSYSFEIVSIGGKIHFYIRIPEAARNAVEAAVYSQYPDAEITVADDYTKNIPQDIPNKDWDLYGADYKMIEKDVYPIKTYPKFFEEKTDIAKEEKRIDPISNLLEGMAKMKPGEQIWLQFICLPVANSENNYVDRGKAVVNEIMKRNAKEKPSYKPIILEALEGLLFGVREEDKKESVSQPFEPDIMLSPGEKDTIKAIENKISKPAFSSTVRFLYLGKKNIFFKPQIQNIFSFFSQFSANNLNGFKPIAETKTKVKKIWFIPWNWLIPRRLYVRKRRIFRNYIKRVPPMFPRPEGTIILDAEEMATLFHFPGRVVAPAPFVPRVESKRGEAPPELPVEE